MKTLSQLARAAEHRLAVIQAVQECLHVPENVLANYPDVHEVYLSMHGREDDAVRLSAQLPKSESPILDAVLQRSLPAGVAVSQEVIRRVREIVKKKRPPESSLPE